jgi:hypothetical protein
MRFLAVALLVAGTARAADRPDAVAAFERLKGLVGEWESVQGGGQKSTSRYELMGSGSTLVEHFAGMGADGMLTVYHLDGDRLLLTHYCTAKNQPRMELKSFDPATGELAFDLIDVTGLSSPAAGHMRRAWFQLPDGNRYSTKWVFFEDGKIAFDETFEFTRVK